MPTSKALGSSTSGSAVCLPNIVKLMWLTKTVLLPIQNTAGICKQIKIIIFHQVSPSSVALLKFIYASVQVYNILVLSVCFKLINFVC
jgi:hypothetical protein